MFHEGHRDHRIIGATDAQQSHIAAGVSALRTGDTGISERRICGQRLQSVGRSLKPVPKAPETRPYPGRGRENLIYINTLTLNGAVEKTRTSTAFRPQRPQRCASTSSATTAREKQDAFALCRLARRGPLAGKIADRNSGSAVAQRKRATLSDRPFLTENRCRHQAATASCCAFAPASFFISTSSILVCAAASSTPSMAASSRARRPIAAS